MFITNDMIALKLLNTACLYTIREENNPKML